MCQLCGIKDTTNASRWPKPLEQAIRDLNFLVDAAHEEWESFRKTKPVNGNVTNQTARPTSSSASRPEVLPKSLLDTLRGIHTVGELLEELRAKWWTAPEKRAMRARLEADHDQQKLTELHKINNATSTRIEAISARLGTFVKWSMGMNGGVWELMGSEKVGK